jgi:hypothetical protein
MTKYPPVPAKSWAEIALEAQRAMRRLFPRLDDFFRPFAMLKVFEGGLKKEFDIGYGVEPLPFGEEGKFNFATNEIILGERAYDDLTRDGERARFTVAHEIGHGLMHGGFMRATSGRVKAFARSSIPAFKDPECQANRFGSEFLLPTMLVLEHIRRGAGHVELSRIFRTSFTATRIKLEDLSKKGLIPKF